MMGLGAALVMPATLSVIVVVFPPEERGKAVGVWVGMAGVGAPIVGWAVGGVGDVVSDGAAVVLTASLSTVVLTSMMGCPATGVQVVTAGARPSQPFRSELHICALFAFPPAGGV